METLDLNPRPPLTFAVHLLTSSGPVYVVEDGTDTSDLDGPTLSRSEIDATLSLACRIAPEGYTRLTLWRALHDLVALKRVLPGTATYVARQQHQPGCGLHWCSTCYPPVPDPEPAQHEQLELPE